MLKAEESYRRLFQSPRPEVRMGCLREAAVERKVDVREMEVMSGREGTDLSL